MKSMWNVPCNDIPERTRNDILFASSLSKIDRKEQYFGINLHKNSNTKNEIIYIWKSENS